MKKLCIAVIVLSFFGLGPLKTFFKNTVGVDGKQMMQTLKDQVEVTKGVNEKQTTNYLVLEKSTDQAVSKTAMLLEYDSTNNKLMVGPLALPSSIKEDNFAQVKDILNKNYHITINHCFLFEQEGIAKIIDMLAPEGVQLSSKIPGLYPNEKAISGKEFVSYLEKRGNNLQNSQYISELFSSLKEEIVKNQSPEKLISIAPTIVNEAAKSITTDLGKGQLISLGVSALMNPVKSIEVIQLNGENGTAKPVNLQLDSTLKSQMKNY